MGLLDGLGKWLKDEFDSVTGQSQPTPQPPQISAPRPQAISQPPSLRVPIAPPSLAPRPVAPPAPNPYKNVAPDIYQRIQAGTHLNPMQKQHVLQQLNTNVPAPFNPAKATAESLGGAAKDMATGIAQSLANVPASGFHAVKATAEFPFNPQAAHNDAATANNEYNNSVVGQVANPAIRLAKTVGQAGAVLTPGQLNPGFNQQLQAKYYQMARQQGMDDQHARLYAFQKMNTVAQRNLSGTDIGPNDSYADVSRKVLSDYGQTVANLYGGAELSAPEEAAATLLGRVGQVVGKANEVGKAGAAVNALAAAHDTTNPVDIAKAAGQGYAGGFVAGGLTHGAPLAADVVKSGVQRVADMTNGPVLTAAEKSSGVLRHNIVNDNEAGTLRDYADYKTGGYQPKGSTINQLDMQARNAASTAGIDVTSGSPVDITNRIYDYLGKRGNFITTHDAILQGGYARLPFPERGEREIDPAAQEYAAEKSPTEIAKEHADMMRSLDQGARGGVIADNGTRSSDHTPFYRQYFAEHGRAPSQAAYLEQATKELEAGKGDMLDPGMADAYHLAKHHEADNAALVDHPNPEMAKESYYYGPNKNPEAFTQADEMKAEASKQMAAAPRNLDAEREALAVLKNGGTRDEAIKAYQKVAGENPKSARFKVQRAAKEAQQALNVSKASENPLLQDFSLPKPNPGEFERVASNRRSVVNSIGVAEQRALSFENKLSPADKTNLIDYAEGTRDIKNAENPSLTQAAVDAWRRAADTVHALGENYGSTKHIEDFFPGYWDREDPRVQEMERLKAEQDLEEQFGTQTWYDMSPEEKEKAFAEYNQNPMLLGEDANYGGFHTKAKTFKNRAEGVAAGYKPLFDNPYDAMRRYFGGAKLQLGNQAIIQGIRDAEPVPLGQRYGINLPGGSPASVGKAGFKILKDQSVRPPANLPVRILKGTTRGIVKTIVANPLIHGQNQEFNALFSAAWNTPGFKPANMMRIIRGQMDLVKNAGEYDKWRTEFYGHGGFSPDYGKNQQGFISKTLAKVGIGPGLTEWSPRTMASLEENIRIATYKMGRDHGMTPDAAIHAVDDALGNSHVLNDTASTFGLFLHYFVTNAKILGRAGLEAKRGNFSPLIGLALAYAAYTGVNKAWQNITGNPDAEVRAPGALGTAIQIAKAPSQIAHGQIPSVVTSHTNPAMRLGAEEAMNRDLSKPVFGPEAANNTLSGPGGSGRAFQILKDTVGPAYDINKVLQGKTTPAETLINLGLGAYTPHASGHQAAPNLPILNTPNAQQGNGLQAQQAYFSAKDAAINSLGNSVKDVDTFNTFLDKERTPDGKTILNSQPQSAGNWSQLASSPTVLNALQKMYAAQANHNPEWDLQGDGTVSGQSAPKLQIWARYKSLAPGDLQRDVISQQNPWIAQKQQEVSSWEQNQTNTGSAVQSPDYVPYPTLSPDQQNMMTAVAQLSSIPAGQRNPDQTNQLSTLENDSRLQSAYSAIQQYTNQVRGKFNLPQIQYAPNYPPEVQNFANAYLDPGKTSADRKAMQANYPTLYNQMEAALEQQQLATVDKQGGIGYYGGNQSNGFLSSIYGLGNYDIAKLKNPNGTNAYALINYGNNTGASGTGQNGLATINANDPNAVSSAASHSSRHKPHHIYMKSAKRIRLHHIGHEKKISLQRPVSPVKIRNRVNKHVGIKRTTYL